MDNHLILLIRPWCPVSLPPTAYYSHVINLKRAFPVAIIRVGRADQVVLGSSKYWEKLIQFTGEEGTEKEIWKWFSLD